MSQVETAAVVTSYIYLPVSDVSRSGEWYAKHLGFEWSPEPGHNIELRTTTGVWIFMRTDYPLPNLADTSGRPVFGLQVGHQGTSSNTARAGAASECTYGRRRRQHLRPLRSRWEPDRDLGRLAEPLLKPSITPREGTEKVPFCVDFVTMGSIRFLTNKTGLVRWMVTRII
jgi:hypothetical protein